MRGHLHAVVYHDGPDRRGDRGTRGLRRNVRSDAVSGAGIASRVETSSPRNNNEKVFFFDTKAISP